MGSSPGASDSSQPNLPKRRPAPFERRLARFSTLMAMPGLLVTTVLVWLQPWAILWKLLLLVAEAFSGFLIGIALRDHILRPLRTLANLVGALREGDYSFRARTAIPRDALGELSLEVNELADLLTRHRVGAIEATALLQRVMEEVDLPIFAFDPANQLRLLNPAGEKLLQRPAAKLLGMTAVALGLENSLSCANQSLVPLHFASGARWFVRRSSFRQQGVPHTLIVLSDVSRVLREEERRAWQRLIRVMGHELNNSLTPIKSIASSLTARLSTADLEAELRQDFERGLGIIEARAASLNRFLQAYRRLAQMPPPVLQQCSLPILVQRLAALETRVAVTVIPGPDVTIMADPDQLEQMIINLLRNAAEAELEPATSGENPDQPDSAPGPEPQVIFSWSLTDNDVILTIEDNGPGLMNPANVFVPFYTTKPGGSGIGLILSRQISEAHGGTLELANRPGHRGCAVKLTLPRTLPL